MASTSNFVQGKDGKPQVLTPQVPPATAPVTPQVTTAPAAVGAPVRKFETVVEKEEPKNILLRPETPSVVVNSQAQAEPVEDEVYLSESTLLEMKAGRDTLALKRGVKLSSLKG